LTTLEIIRQLCKKNDISITSLEEKLGYSNGSISKSNVQFMRSDRLMAIASYFGVTMEYLMGSDKLEWNPETQELVQQEDYYINEETKDVAQFLYDNPEYRILFDASRKVKPEDLKKAVKALGIFTED
jgi:transcriptional regulator with XRE-family HTH domain